VSELGIPRPYRGGFEALLELDDAAAQRFSEALDQAPKFAAVADLVERAKSVVPEEQRLQTELVIQALLSVRGQLREMDAGELARDLSESIDLEFDSEQRKGLRERLTPLLKSEALRSTANAVDLLTQNRLNYASSRSFSDVRPVFDDDVHTVPTGAVIVETLQLRTWSKDGSTDILHIAMDESDLREIRDVLDRALEKTETLKTLLRSQQITYFQLDKRKP
jgi:hypothetical protein